MIGLEFAEGIKGYKSDRAEDIDRLVDEIISKNEKHNPADLKIKKPKKRPLFSSNKKKHVINLANFFKKKTIKRIISGFVLLILIFALLASSFPQLYGNIETDVIITLEPRSVYNGDTIYINVSIPEYYNISSLSADVGSGEDIDLILIDNSSDYHIWGSSFYVQDFGPGFQLATVTGFNLDNVTYSASVEWKVLETEVNESSGKDGNESIDPGVNGSSSDDFTNVTDDPGINETSNETTPPIDDVNKTNNESDVPDTPNIVDDTIDSADIIGLNVSEVFYDEFEDTGREPFIYHRAPENSIGVSEMKIVNPNYFWDYFDRYAKWDLELYNSDLGEWTSYSDYLEISNILSEDNDYEKTTLNFVIPETAIYRLTFTIDASVKSYIAQTDEYEYILEYSVAGDEIYRAFFDWSDIIDIPDITWDSGVAGKGNRDVFWFRITSNDVVPEGTFVSIDPTFGYTSVGADKTEIENIIVAGYFQMDDVGGIADSITVNIYDSGADKSGKCAIYDSSKNLLVNGVTNEVTFGGGWRTLTFPTSPTLVANEYYYLVVWCAGGSGIKDVYYTANDGAGGVFSQSQSYNGFPSSVTLGTTVDDDGRLSIYCTYTGDAPSQESQSVWDGFTNHSLNATDVFKPPVSFNVTISDANGDDMNITIMTNGSESWEVVNQTSGSGLTNGTYSFTNTSWVDSNNTKYWISFNVSDGVDWSNETFNFTTVTDLPSGDPFIYSDLPSTSLGVNTKREMDWNYFWNLFNSTNLWVLEDSGNGNTWTKNNDVALNVTKVRSADNISDKITLNFTADSYAYYRIRLDIQKPVLSYEDDSDNYQYNLTYEANATENFTVFFNWSDYIGSPEAGSTTCSYGIKTAHGNDYFYFEIKTDNKLDVGESLEIDPTFGRSASPSASTPLENTIRGMYASPVISGTADSISVNLYSITGASKDVKCAIYDYTDYSSNYAGALVAETEEKSISATEDGWNTFNFASSPLLVAGTNYYIVAWSDSGTGDMEIGYVSTGGSDGISKSETYDGSYEDPLTGESATVHQYYIYCTYTEVYPTIDGENPSSGSTGEDPTPTLNVTVDDPNDDTLSVTWWSNSTGPWAQFDSNSSIDTSSGAVNIIQDNSNFSGYSTKYYWSVNVSDGTYWTNETFNFTTRATYTSDAPASFSATAASRFQIDLSWTDDSEADSTLVEWHTAEDTSWNRGDHTELYNGSAGSTSQSSLNPSTTRYYKAWSYNVTDNTWSSGSTDNATTLANTAPLISSESPANESSGQELDFTWSATIEDPDGDSFDWWINCSNGDETSDTSASNGTKQLSISGLSYNTDYIVYVNVTDGYNWTREWFNFTTKSTTNPPTQTNEGPTNGSTGVSPLPALNVTVDDLDDDTLNVTWWSNSTGPWAQFGSNSSIDTSSGEVNITQTNSNFSDYVQKYWWSVNLSDGYNWTNETYHFTITEFMNTSVDAIDPYTVEDSPLTINATATSEGTPDNVTLYYRWSDDNSTWDGGIGSETNDAVDSNTSDVDSVSDSGNETNFANAQDTSPDSDFMNIEEIDKARLDNPSFTGGTTGWTLSGMSYDATDYQDSAGSCYDPGGDPAINYVTQNSYHSFIESETVTFSCYWMADVDQTGAGTSSGTCYAQVENESDPGTWNTIYTVFSNNQASQSWTYTGTQDVSAFFGTGNYRLRFRIDSQESNNGHHQTNIDNCRLIASSSKNYTIDFEYQWTVEDYNRTNEEVCIYVDSHTGSENLNVNYRNGASWTSLGSITGTGWTNLTAAGLTSSTYTIQLTGASESEDTSQDDWDIDCLFLHTWESTGGIHGHNWTNWSDASNPDTASPWTWEFDFPNSTGYYEFYSIGKKSGVTDETAPSSADAICYASVQKAPTQSAESPTNGTTNIDPIPSLYVVCSDADYGDTLNATWWSNSTGPWAQFGSNETSFASGTNITQTNNNFSLLGTTFWWSVNLTDGEGGWNNETYHFTTNYAPTQTNPWPENEQAGVPLTPTLNITISDLDNDIMTAYWLSNSTGSWEIFGTNSSISTGTTIYQTNSNFSEKTTIYWWSVNVTDGCNWTNVTYCFTTSYLPLQTNQSIWDGFSCYLLNNTDVNVNITSFNVTISDIDGQKMNVTILTNSSGSWSIVNQSSGAGLSNGTYGFTNTSWVDTYNTQYWVSFNVTNGNCWKNETFNFTTVTIPPSGEPYEHATAGGNAFGANNWNETNHTFFWDFVDYYGVWAVEESSDNITWYKNNTALDITTSQSSDQERKKFTLNFTANKYGYYRLVMNFKKPLLAYWDNSTFYEYSLKFAANATENYTMYFNWSDFIDSDEALITTCNYGVKTIDGKNYFYWIVTTNDPLNADESLEIDPTFGDENEGTSGDNLENTIRGSNFQMPENGNANNISAYLYYSTSGSYTYSVKAAIYDNNGVFQGSTDERSLSNTDGIATWETFIFSTPPTLTANDYYYIVIWADSPSGSNAIELRYVTGTNNNFYSSEVYGSWPNSVSFSDQTGSAQYNIYCTYTANDPPVINFPGPADESTGQNPTPICNVTVSDPDGGTVDVYFYENTTGDDTWVLQQTNSSVDVTSPANVEWDNYNNATVELTIYWWRVVVIDDIGAIVEDYFQFTTVGISVSIAPNTWHQGTLTVGSSNETESFYFEITNDGSTSIDLQIKASNATNATTGANWKLNETVDLDNYTLQYNLSDGGTTWTNINLTYDSFVSNLASSSSKTFDLKLILATYSSKSDPLEITLTFRSVLS